jgi:mannose-6-phosphate isomerase
MKKILYPLQFNPIFKERIWGGEKLKSIFNKPVLSKLTGESWEISTVEDNVSIVSHGEYEGKSLVELVDAFPSEILGTKVHEKFGKQFPLLFKYLDAQDKLSIQLHPNDELAGKRHNSFGKTEMWYVVQAEKDSKLILGFKENSNPEKYLENLKKNTLESILNEVKVKKGDAFLIETGTVHALGSGIVVAEVQQTSDITYRLYDFDRQDSQGKKRELHIDEALEAINYNKTNTYIDYKKTANASNTIVDCDYFTTNYISLNGKIDYIKNGHSFTVYMCTEGKFEIIVQGKKYEYIKGDTILIPAGLKTFSMSGEATILEIYIS